MAMNMAGHLINLGAVALPSQLITAPGRPDKRTAIKEELKTKDAFDAFCFSAELQIYGSKDNTKLHFLEGKGMEWNGMEVYYIAISYFFTK